MKLTYCITCGEKNNPSHTIEECLETVKMKLDLAVDVLDVILYETECPVSRELAKDALESIRT